MLFNLPDLTILGQDTLPELTDISHDKGTVPVTSDLSLDAFKLSYSSLSGHYEGIIQNVQGGSFGDLFAYFVSVGSPAPSHLTVRANGIRIPPQGCFISIPPKSNIDIYLSTNQANCPFLGLYYHR